jgi:hypothetical protein
LFKIQNSSHIHTAAWCNGSENQNKSVYHV